MVSENFKIKYRLTSEDVASFNIDHLKRRPGWKKTNFIYRICMASMYAGTGIVWFLLSPGNWPVSWIFVFVAILWWCFYTKTWERRIRKQVLKAYKKQNRPIPEEQGVHELILNSEKIVAKHNNHEGAIRWDQILQAVVREDYAFLYMTDLDAIIIPKHGLQNVNDWRYLVAFIEKKVSKSN